MTKQRRTFTPEFKREAACLVLDQGYSLSKQPVRLGWLSRPCADGLASSKKSETVFPGQQGADARAAKNSGTGSPDQSPGAGKVDSKKGHRALDGRGARAFGLIDQFRAEEPVDLLCSVFEVPRSCYYAHCRKRRSPYVKRLLLRSRVNELFTQSRSAAGSRSIMFMMREDGIEIGRFKVRKLMSEMKLISKQPGSHAYKKATVERPDIPNVLDRVHRIGTERGLVR
jgi:putative transposase